MLKTMQPMGRAGRDQAISRTVLHFTSKVGAYCSDTIHVTDGGRLDIQPGTTY